MKLYRAARVAAMTLAVMGLVSVGAPPASARAVGNFTFVGTMALSAGLDYPCVNPEGGKPCPPTTIVHGMPSKKTEPFVVNGNTRSGSISASLCVGNVQNVSKRGKNPSEGLICSMNASFTIKGFCALASGSGRGTFATLPGQTYFFNFTFTYVGSKFIMRGNYWKGSAFKPPDPEGDLNINADIDNNLNQSPVNSCLEKTAKVFFVAGSGHLVHPKTSP